MTHPEELALIVANELISSLFISCMLLHLGLQSVVLGVGV